MKLKLRTAAVIAMLVLSATAERGARTIGARAIWAVSDGEKIEQDELNSPLKNRNTVWDGKKIKLFGARNEIIAFQV
ncbi:MAG: hypothetical protein ABIS29_06660, partial [Vicinamibacterales bacterium]